MAWSRNKVDSATINDGNEYVKGSRVSRQNLNAMVNSGLYAQDFAEKLVTNIDTSEIGGTGTPSVTLIAGDGATAEKPYKKFKFSNLKGEKGDKGDTGSQGIQGVKGDIGATPNISVAATTLAAGSQATATRSGTDESPIITFGIPKGDKGEKGDSGSNGYSILYSNRSDTSSTTEYISKDSMTIPSGYNVKAGDFILCANGDFFKITSVLENICYVEFLYVIGSSGVGGSYDQIITNQAEFETMISSADWGGAHSVLFVGDGTSVQFTSKSRIVIPENVYTINGIGFPKISITLSSSVEYPAFGLNARTDTAFIRHSLSGISIVAKNTGASLYATIGGFTDVSNCYISGSSTTGDANAVRNCERINSCHIVASPKALSNSYDSLSNCSYISNCKCFGTVNSCSYITNVSASVSTNDLYDKRAFVLCSNISNCLATGATGYYGCSYGSCNKVVNAQTASLNCTKWSAETND